jgi:hypothetical protein
MAQQEYINVGATANDGQGDPLRVAFEKINNNFTNLFQTGTFTSTAYTTGTDAGQVILEVSTGLFTQATFQIRSNDVDSTDTQDITISAQLSSDNTAVTYTGFATMHIGNVLSSYSMDVSSGNVRLMADPIADATLFHFIAAEVTYIGPVVQTMALSLENDPSNVLATQNSFTIATEQV